MLRIGIVLLARLGSTRLPGKVLLDLAGKPVLQWVVERLRPVAADQLVVATTDNPKDDPVAQFCQGLGAAVFRGSEENVLARCLGAAQAFEFQAIIRLGADSPLVDHQVINQMLALFRRAEANGEPLDYLSNSLERTFPLGLDADVMTVDTLLAIREAAEKMPPEERASNQSNVVPYLHQNLDRFKTQSYRQEADHSAHRWTLDTPEDFELIGRIYRELAPAKPGFLMADVLELLARRPDWPAINSGVVPRTGFWSASERGKYKSQYGADLG